MNFRPRNPNRHLWDTWFYDHNGEYHLFYLSNRIADDGRWIPWDAFSLATSRDLLHWEEKGEVFHKSENPADWDSELITTGDIIRWRGRWYMTYRATQDRVEKNNIIVSDDLLNWQRISPSPVLVTSEPYEHDPEQTINNYVEMRCDDHRATRRHAGGRVHRAAELRAAYGARGAGAGVFGGHAPLAH
ncbi:MAG TPA: hypothetical protein PKZ25_14485, partial [Candidatus Hydrogenedentes bacterium]|nr:hypothetical protein [Candidatus Hydrogenedentota bacterium]